MIKKIFSVAVLAISMAVLPSVAQTTTEKGDKCPKTECQGKGKCEGKGPKSAKFDRDAKLFEGITLTDAQKQQLSDLKEKTRDERKAKSETAKTERKEKKAVDKEAMKAKKAAKEQSRREYLKEMKKILGNDNYVVFLENNFVVQSSPMKKDQAKSKEIKREKKGQPKGDRPMKAKQAKDKK